MGGVTTSDLTVYLAERFKPEIETARVRERADLSAPIAIPKSAPEGPQAWPESSASMAVWGEHNDDKVERLSHEERGKIFDLPPPVVAPVVRPHFLDLESAQIPTLPPARREPIARVRIGGHLAVIVRATAVATITLALMLGALRFVWRF